jgi:hypothetical protein
MNNDRDILLVAIFTFLTVSIWMFFELIKTTKTSTIAPTSQQLLLPLKPTIDIELLKKLELREQ